MNLLLCQSTPVTIRVNELDLWIRNECLQQKRAAFVWQRPALSQGYEMVRVSVIASSQDDAADFPFAYREAFRYRWTKHFLLSSVMELPGEVDLCWWLNMYIFGRSFLTVS